MFFNQINFGPELIFSILFIILALFVVVKNFIKKGNNNLNKPEGIGINKSEFNKIFFGTIFNFKNNIGNVLNTLIRISESIPLADMADIKANLYIPKINTPDMPRAMVVWEINKTIDGYLYLQKLGGKMFLTKEAGLESVEFNKNVLTYASSPKLPFYVLPPNLMTWYLDQEKAPIIYIKDKSGYVVFMDSLGKDEYMRISSELLKQIKRSGAFN